MAPHGEIALQAGKIAFPETYGQKGRKALLSDLVAAAERAAVAVPVLGNALPELAFDGQSICSADVMGLLTFASQ